MQNWREATSSESVANSPLTLVLLLVILVPLGSFFFVRVGQLRGEKRGGEGNVRRFDIMCSHKSSMRLVALRPQTSYYRPLTFVTKIETRAFRRGASARRRARRLSDSIEHRWSIKVYHTFERGSSEGMREARPRYPSTHAKFAVGVINFSVWGVPPPPPRVVPASYFKRHMRLLIFKPGQRRIGAGCQEVKQRTTLRDRKDVLMTVDLKQAYNELQSFYSDAGEKGVLA